jgi:hypothetical protein
MFNIESSHIIKKPADYKSASFKTFTLQPYAMLCNLMQLHHAAHIELNYLILST